MHKRFLPTALIGTCLLFIINWSCTKIDTTNLGSDLIPAVDNIHTFDTTLDIISTQGYFTDTTQVLPTENYALGRINADPLFGTTQANIYLQVKPNVYPFIWGNAGDTLIAADSVVLCLSFKGSWGDSVLPQQLEVYKIDDANFRDSVNASRDVNYQPNTTDFLGSATINPLTLKDTIFIAHHKDSVANQIRIRLSDAFRDYLFSRDTSLLSPNNQFNNDSLYRLAFNGLAVKAVGASSQSLLYIALADANTRLEMHFRKKNAGTGYVDTVYNSLRVTPGNSLNIAPSGTANYIARDRTGTPSATASLTEHYLQTSPGTYINLNIPGLTNLSNRIVHRAYITIQQIPTDPASDNIFTQPPYLYLDLKDTNTVTPIWKPIYHDLNPNVAYDPDNKTGLPFFPVSVTNNSFGGVAKTQFGVAGKQVYYQFNITRYIQRLVTQHATNYQMRVWPAYNISYPQYAATEYPYSNPIAYGRIKVGSGSNPNPAYKMTLHIIYSKIQ
ncbi:MAG: DUF4270 family protein [Bacteroidetes bacterium]|nr:DUF4270 family protein [Bacteroidota bacterium]MBS1755743.1 DUF4270 family protein [Bacteroidota bacterium]